MNIMESWHFIPKVGISCSIGQINFGDSPEDVKKKFGNSFHNMKHDVQGTGCSLRLEYSYQGKLAYILFCNGSLKFEGMEITGIPKPQLKSYLKKKGFTIKKLILLSGEYCPQISLYFASSKDNGGETNIINTIGMFYGEEYHEQFK